MKQGLYVVFDGPPDHDAPQFVEVEDQDGNGVRVEWAHRADGYWCLGPFQRTEEVAR